MFLKHSTLFVWLLFVFEGFVIQEKKQKKKLISSWGLKWKKHRPNVLENTSLTTAIFVCCQLIGGKMSTLFDFPQFSQGWHIVNIPPDALAKCFPRRMRAMFGERKRPGGFY